MVSFLLGLDHLQAHFFPLQHPHQIGNDWKNPSGVSYSQELEYAFDPAYKEFVAPILEIVEDVKLADGVTTTTLEAVITNEMPNFDYRYQWYVSDSADGDAIAIEGATNSTYDATVSNPSA